MPAHGAASQLMLSAAYAYAFGAHYATTNLLSP